MKFSFLFKRMVVFTLFIMAGLIVLVLHEQFKLKHLPSALFLVVVFAILNLVASMFLRQPDVIAWYDFKKIWLFAAGILVAALIHSFSYIAGFSQQVVEKSIDFTALSLLSVLLIVLWEELWFRNLLLADVKGNKEQVAVSLYVGFLFLIMHFFNPEFSLNKQGLNVFAGGAFLTLIFMEYKSFWLPLGVHFANNILELKMDEQLLSTVSPVSKFAIAHGSTVITGILYLSLAFYKIGITK